MYLIILECVKSSLDINIFKKYVIFFIKISWLLMWLNWSIATIKSVIAFFHWDLLLDEG